MKYSRALLNLKTQMKASKLSLYLHIKWYKNLIQFKPFLHKVKVSDLREIINKHKKIPKPKYEGTFMGSQISE